MVWRSTGCPDLGLVQVLRLLLFEVERRGRELREAELLVRHPNYSGMQMDQVSRLYVPAHYVKAARIWQGDDLLLSLEGGISIAENPEFRFDYRPNGASGFRTEVDDSEGKTFSQDWPATPA